MLTWLIINHEDEVINHIPPFWLQALLQLNPYHIDSLLQLSDVCRIQEDQEMARDLIGWLQLLLSPTKTRDLTRTVLNIRPGGRSTSRISGTAHPRQF